MPRARRSSTGDDDPPRPGGLPQVRPHGARDALGPRRLPRARLHAPSTCTASPRSAANARDGAVAALDADERRRASSEAEPLRRRDRHARLHAVRGGVARDPAAASGASTSAATTPAPGLPAALHRGPGRARRRSPPTSPGRPGPRSPTAPARTTRTPTTGPTSRWSATGPTQLDVPLERAEPDHAARRHRRDPLRLRQVRLPRLGRRGDARALPRQPRSAAGS